MRSRTCCASSLVNAMGGSIQRFRAAVYAVAGARKGGPTQLHEGQHADQCAQPVAGQGCVTALTGRHEPQGEGSRPRTLPQGSARCRPSPSSPQQKGDAGRRPGREWTLRPNQNAHATMCRAMLKGAILPRHKRGSAQCRARTEKSHWPSEPPTPAPSSGAISALVPAHRGCPSPRCSCSAGRGRLNGATPTRAAA